MPHFKEQSGLRGEGFVDWCSFSIRVPHCPASVSTHWEPSHYQHSVSCTNVSRTNSCTLIVPLREFTDSDSDRPCYSHVSFIARFVDSCDWAWQLTWPCGGPMLLGGPACRNAALWLEEARLGWMSTVHRAGGMRDCTDTPPLAFSALLPFSLLYTHVQWDTVAMFFSPQPLFFFSSLYTFMPFVVPLALRGGYDVDDRKFKCEVCDSLLYAKHKTYQ